MFRFHINHSSLSSPSIVVLADPISLIDKIHGRHMLAGVAISPDTPSTAITNAFAEAADMLLVMTVYPGPCPALTVPSAPSVR